MIKLLGKAKLHTIEVKNYLHNMELIRNVIDNFIGVNETVEIQVYEDYLLATGDFDKATVYFMGKRYNLTTIEERRCYEIRPSTQN